MGRRYHNTYGTFVLGDGKWDEGCWYHRTKQSNDVTSVYENTSCELGPPKILKLSNLCV